MTLKDKLAVLIAAAGKGSRSGLSYPKTLYSIKGIPIIVRQLEVFSKYDFSPTLIVSPSGKNQIKEKISQFDKNAYFVCQEHPNGMGDAVLQFLHSPAYERAEHIILSWGDIPFIQQSTIDRLVKEHFIKNNDFTFPTKLVNAAYTQVTRDSNGNVEEVIETRGSANDIIPGERDMGIFIFKKQLVMDQLQEEVNNKYNSENNEHGFLYVIGELVKKGLQVEALNIATELDLISLNKISDLGHFNS